MTPGRLRAVLTAVVLVALAAGSLEAILRTNPISQIDELSATPSAGTSGEEIVPVELDIVAEQAEARQVAIETDAPVMVADDGTDLYVGDAAGRLERIRVDDPDRPAVASLELPAPPVNATAYDGTLFVADSWGGLQILDVSEPDRLAPLGALPTDSLARSVVVTGTVAYVAEWETGLRVVDVGDRAAPSTVATIALAGFAYDVALDGDRLYVAGFDGGVHVLDVSDPMSPIVLGAWTIFPAAVGVDAQNGLIYVTDEQGGLRAVDSRSWEVMAAWITQGPPHGLALDEGEFVVSDLTGNVYWGSLDGDSALRVGAAPGAAPVTSVTLFGGTAYFTDGTSVWSFGPGSRDE